MCAHRFRLIVLTSGCIVFLGCPRASLTPGFYGERDTGHISFHARDSRAADSTVYEMVYFPSVDGKSIDPEAVPCPVIMFAPGFNCPPLLYRSYGKQLASWGYIVHMGHYIGTDNVATTQDISDQLDWLLERNAIPGNMFEGTVDETRIGVTGHSMGAKYTVMACIEDDRFITGVSLDPVDASASFGSGSERFPAITPERMSELAEPMLFIGTEYPSRLTPVEEDFHQFFIHAVSPAQELRVLNSDHVSFIDDLGLFHDFMHFVFGNHRDVDDVTAKNVAIRYMASWFNVHLKGRTEFQTYLTGAMAQQDVAQGLVEIETNF